MVHHFYTTDPKGELALQGGYRYLGIACYVYTMQVKDTVPVYRCFNPSTNNHFYTTSRSEFDNAIQNYGYTPEFIGWFMFDADQNPPNTVALNRYYNEETMDHLYFTGQATSYAQRYVEDGIAGHVLNDDGLSNAGNSYQSRTSAVPLYWWATENEGDRS